jgi:hypothetical protein
VIEASVRELVLKVEIVDCSPTPRKARRREVSTSSRQETSRPDGARDLVSFR